MKTQVLIITSIILALFGCEKDRSIKRIGTVQIDNSIITDTVLQNEIATAAIRASANNGCWSNLFVDLEKTNTFEYSIKASGIFSCFEGGCACPDIMVYHDTIIEFRPNQIGKYIFRIQKNQSSLITDTLIVK